LLCVRLGIWQLERLQQRRASNAAIRSDLARPAVSLPADINRAEALEYRHASVRGTFDPSHEIYLTNRALDGIAGVHVVTPLELEGTDRWILVDRGWLADTDYRGSSPQAWASEGTVRLEGVLLPSQEEPALAFLGDKTPAPGEPPLREWRALSLPGIAAQLPFPLLDVYLLMDQQEAGPSLLTPDPQIDLSEGPHLSYAIQWFAFAAIAFVGGAAWFRRGRRSPAR
jgi:surfeit locus 1 family protein